MESLRSRPCAGVSTVNGDLEVAKHVDEQGCDPRMIYERLPPFDVRCLVVDLDVKSRTWRLGRECGAQLRDDTRIEEGRYDEIANVLESGDPVLYRGRVDGSVLRCHGERQRFYITVGRPWIGDLLILHADLSPTRRRSGFNRPDGPRLRRVRDRRTPTSRALLRRPRGGSLRPAAIPVPRITRSAR